MRYRPTGAFLKEENIEILKKRTHYSEKELRSRLDELKQEGEVLMIAFTR